MRGTSLLRFLIAPYILIGGPLDAQDKPPAVPAANVEIFAANKVSEADLSAIAGREDLAQLAQAKSQSEVSQNSVGENSRTGNVSIADNAFQNLSGLSVLNLNSGNNVAINASMSVNISLAPPQ
jgi:hypothetical protein